MACGCILVAYRQGHGEELGLIDIGNIILYSDAETGSKGCEHYLSSGFDLGFLDPD